MKKTLEDKLFLSAIAGVATSTVGVGLAGIYEGYTGQNALGMEHVARNSAMLAYVSQIAGTLGITVDPLNRQDVRQKQQMVFAATMIPIMPLVSSICYGIGEYVGMSIR